MAIRDLMNTYFYGKQGKADMTVADLPANRRELFFTVFKVRWSALTGVNLLYLIFWIPAILWTGYNLMAVVGMQAAEAGTYVREDYMGIAMTWLMVLFPCIAITGPFNAGVTFVLRNWARDQHSFILSDFRDAVRNNWKQALAVSCISGILPLLIFVGVRFYGDRLTSSVAFVVPIGVMMIVGVLWSLATMLMYPMLITYDLKLRDVIRNSMLLTLAKLPFAMLFKAITLVVPALLLMLLELAPAIQNYVLLVGTLLYVGILPAFNKLVTVSYANWLCETYLNTRIEGAQTNIGLRPENWDDVEYRPEDDE